MTLTRKKSLSLVGLVLVFASTTSFADEPKVEITSFDYVNNAGRVAEVCGKVTGVDAATLVRVVVDTNSSNPGVYNVMAGKDGHFCAVVASYRGTVSASLDFFGRSTESGVVSAQVASRR